MEFFLPHGHIQVFPIFIASVVCFSIGTFWYSPALFGNIWLKHIGRTKEEVDDRALKYFGLAYAAILLECYMMKNVVNYLGAESMTEGIVVGIIVWLGFSVPTSTFSYMLEHRSRKLLLIHSGYFLAMFIISATLLAMWK
ncbi:MAG: DUF1761 domain-containing protein [Bacteroidetes bacterium]|nr:DUF1761 domain-containing protein [Bacteroidota bacterium]